jgi:hypothetical protein
LPYRQLNNPSCHIGNLAAHIPTWQFVGRCGGCTGSFTGSCAEIRRRRAFLWRGQRGQWQAPPWPTGPGPSTTAVSGGSQRQEITTWPFFGRCGSCTGSCTESCTKIRRRRAFLWRGQSQRGQRQAPPWPTGPGPWLPS